MTIEQLTQEVDELAVLDGVVKHQLDGALLNTLASIDEVNNELTFNVTYDDGTVRAATLALV